MGGEKVRETRSEKARSKCGAHAKAYLREVSAFFKVDGKSRNRQHALNEALYLLHLVGRFF